MIIRFKVGDAKLVNTPLANHFMLKKSSCHSLKKEFEEAIPYLLVVESLMCTMLYTRLDVAHVVGIVSKLFSNPKKESLRSSQVDSQVPNGYVKVMLIFWES